MFNEVTLVGRLTRDAEVSEINNAQKTPVVRFTLAVDRDYQVGGKTPADFWPVNVAGEWAVKRSPQLTRGRLVLVAGSVHLDSRKDEEGTYHTYPFVTCRQLRLLGKPTGSGGPRREPGQDDE